MRTARLLSLPWLLLTLSFAAWLVTSAVLYPVFRAPDERAHVDMSRQVAERLERGEPAVHAPGEVRWLSEQVREAGARTGLTGPPAALPPLPATQAPPRAERPPFAALGPAEASGLRNQMTQHPPAYYLLTGTASRWLEAPRPHGVPFDLQVVLLRLLSAALVVPLPALAALTARWLGGDEVAAGLAALLPLGVPMLAHIGAAVNNDALLVFAGVAATPLLVAAACGRRSWPATVAVAALAGIGLLAKGFGLVLPVWVALAYAAGSRRGAGRGALAHGLVATAGALAVGGWWWVRNLVVLGELQPQHAALPRAPDAFAPDWAWWAPFAARRFTQRFFVEPDTVQEAPGWELLAAAGLLVLVAAGLAAARRGRLAPALVALTPVAGAVVAVAAGGAALYRETGGVFGIHGRYTYLGLAGLFAVAGLALSPAPAGSARRHRHGAGARWRPVAVATVAGAVVALHAWGFVAALGFYWGTPDGGLTASLRAALAWSPLPPALVAGSALASWLLLAAGAFALVRAARAPA